MSIQYGKIPDYMEPEHLLQDTISIVSKLDKLNEMVIIVSGELDGKPVTKKSFTGRYAKVIWHLKQSIDEIVNKLAMDQKEKGDD